MIGSLKEKWDNIQSLFGVLMFLILLATMVAAFVADFLFDTGSTLEPARR